MPSRQKLWRELTKLGALVVVVAVVGFIVAASGVIPIKASSGHWPITAWFLSFSMHRSVSTHTVGIDPPPLEDTSLVLKGAGHFEVGCRPCHGSPGLEHPRIARRMTPHPPDLSASVPDWEPEELFYIVKHGVKFTGMPAWPAEQRDDEVWAVTAFLLRLPELTAEQYKRLARGEAMAGDGSAAPLEELVAPDTPLAIRSCARCHGVEGRGRGRGAFPGLAGQSADYLAAALEAYARNERYSGIMEPMAAELSGEEIQSLARFYARLARPLALADAADPQSEGRQDAIARGEAIARQGVPDRNVPSCIDCHGPTDSSLSPLYPSLAGQYAEYLLLQLELFQARKRGGSSRAHLMYPAADGLSPTQMDDVAAYYASLGPEE